MGPFQRGPQGGANGAGGAMENMMSKKTKREAGAADAALSFHGAHLRVDSDSYTVVEREGDPEDRWDGDDTAATTTVNALVLAGEDDYRDLTVGHPVAAGDTLHLLYAVYGTGDSFSHQSGCVEWIDAYRTKAEAEKAADAIRAHYRRYERSKNSREDPENFYSVRLPSSIGVEFTLSCPWIGYFESLEDVVVAPLPVKAAAEKGAGRKGRR